MNTTAAGSTQSQSFATYLARSYIAKKGFQAATVPEAAGLTAASDIVLTRADGMNFQIICIVDRERNPGKQFALSRAAVAEIGKACLKYSGKMNGVQMPVVIHVMEIGPGPVSGADYKRLKTLKRPSMFSKAHIAAWSIDTARKSVWSNAWLKGLLLGRPFVEKMLRAPRVSEAELAPKTAPALSRERFPVLTCGLLALLIGVFVLEHRFAIGSSSGLFAPSISTLIALGGLHRDLVLQHGEWFRLFSATLLHGSLLHLILNGVALYLAGSVLETLVGRVWFLALFVIGAVGGSLLSLAINPATVVSVGASGAIMGLLAGAFVSSFRLPSGVQRTQIQMSMMQVLIPSLIPLATVGTGHKVDFAAHLGGALVGATVGLVMLKNWRLESALPRFVGAAGAIAAMGVAAYAFAAVSIQQRYSDHVLYTHLVPQAEVPKNASEMAAKAEELIAKYPRDPRPHLWRAVGLLRANEVQSAEVELRAALKEDEILTKMFKPELKQQIQASLALTLKDLNREAEAVDVAAAPCTTMPLGDLRKSLTESGLCK